MRASRRKPPRKPHQVAFRNGRPPAMQETIMAMPQAAPPVQTHAKYERLIAGAQRVRAAKTAGVPPCDESSLGGGIEAPQADLIVPILVGPAGKITAVARERKLDIGKFEVVDAPHSDAAAA